MALLGWMVAVLILVAVGAAVYGLHRLLLRLEDRGLVYYSRKKPEGSTGSFLGPLHEIYDPPIKHVYEVKSHERHEEGDEAGDRGPEGQKRWYLTWLKETLEREPVDVEAVRACLEAAGKGGHDSRGLYEAAVRAARPRRESRIPAWEEVAPGDDG